MAKDKQAGSERQAKTGRRRFVQAAVTASAVGAANLYSPAGRASQGDDEPLILAKGAKGGSMPRRPLGNTGETVPVIHLGTSQRLDPSYDKLLHRSFKSGVDWFDTALSYGWGSSHRAIASFLGQMGDRKKLWLTSKSGARSVKRLKSGAEQALEELQTDYLDVFLMHGIDDVQMLDREHIELGETLKREGKIKYFGFSCHDGNVANLLDAAADRGGIDTILFRYNFRRYGERELNLAMDKCHKVGIGLLAMKTMGSVPADLESVAGFKIQELQFGSGKVEVSLGR